MSPHITVVDNEVHLEGGTVILGEYAIRHAFIRDDRLVVLYEPDAVKGKFANLVCFSFDGRKLWTAELPEPHKQDTYYKIAKEQPLTAYSFSSYECEIDTQDGMILRKNFFR